MYKKVDVEIGGQCQPLVVGKFLAAIPGQRTAQFTWQVLDLFSECRHDARRVLVADLGKHHIAGTAFDQGGNEAVLRPGDQIAFPVPSQCLPSAFPVTGGIARSSTTAGRSRIDIASLI